MSSERTSSGSENYRNNEGLRSSDDIRTGFITGITFDIRPVQYSVVNELAMFEGDIVLGTVQQMEQGTHQLRERMVTLPLRDVDSDVAQAVGITGQRFRWPDGLMPYVIDDGLPNAERVLNAIAHWERRTMMRFVERTSDNAAQYLNYVHFIRSDGCWAEVGMQGDGLQEIGLSDTCNFGSAVHEIGHAWGLWHEQSREDRDDFVRINWQNIEPGREHNFNQHITDGDDYGPYDYGSIMHYGMFAFSTNGPTIEPLRAGVTIGQRDGLSQRDVDGVHAMYGLIAPALLEPVLVQSRKEERLVAATVGMGEPEPEADGLASEAEAATGMGEPEPEADGLASEAEATTGIGEPEPEASEARENE
jgi:astacin